MPAEGEPTTRGRGPGRMAPRLGRAGIRGAEDRVSDRAAQAGFSYHRGTVRRDV
jgi:hypothetical protein